MKLTKTQSLWLDLLHKYGKLTTPQNSAHAKTFEALVKKGTAKVVKVSNGYTTYEAVQ